MCIFDAPCEILVTDVTGDFVYATADGRDYAITMYPHSPRPSPGEAALYVPFDRGCDTSFLNGHPCRYTACLS
jgi:hypothetical protein